MNKMFLSLVINCTGDRRRPVSRQRVTFSLPSQGKWSQQLKWKHLWTNQSFSFVNHKQKIRQHGMPFGSLKSISTRIGPALIFQIVSPKSAARTHLTSCSVGSRCFKNWSKTPDNGWFCLKIPLLWQGKGTYA